MWELSTARADSGGPQACVKEKEKRRTVMLGPGTDSERKPSCQVEAVRTPPGSIAVLLGPFADVEFHSPPDLDEPEIQPVVDGKVEIGVGDYQAHCHDGASGGLGQPRPGAVAVPAGLPDMWTCRALTAQLGQVMLKGFASASLAG